MASWMQPITPSGGNEFGATGSNPADADGNGVVDHDDYAIWRSISEDSVAAPASGTRLERSSRAEALSC